jgi:hypothetical protein
MEAATMALVIVEERETGVSVEERETAAVLLDVAVMVVVVVSVTRVVASRAVDRMVVVQKAVVEKAVVALMAAACAEVVRAVEAREGLGKEELFQDRVEGAVMEPEEVGWDRVAEVATARAMVAAQDRLMAAMAAVTE